MTDAPSSISPGTLTTAVSLAFVLAAALILTLPPGNEPAGAGSPPGRAVTIDPGLARSSNGPSIVRTDAHHAVLGLRAGYRVHIMHPAGTGHVRPVAPSEHSTDSSLHMIYLMAAALLGSFVGALGVAARRTRRLPSF